MKQNFSIVCLLPNITHEPVDQDLIRRRQRSETCAQKPVVRVVVCVRCVAPHVARVCIRVVCVVRRCRDLYSTSGSEERNKQKKISSVTMQ